MSDNAEGGNELVLRCAWCNEVRDPDGRWVRLSAADLRRLEARNRLTHGMCPTCYARLTGTGDADRPPG